MQPEPTTELTVIEATPSQAPQPSKASRAAIKRCMAAWKRVYQENLKYSEPTRAEKALAELFAGPAYCAAMPPLAGYENIRDFIACAAHGILIDAIPEKRANQLLYAAQVALVSLNYEPKAQKSA
ncbi:MAG: hypothetical protein P4K86_06330 [Terracidiphilus sp.]|nr:hypothetical protein [Terracidiphilus sp.]MDR3777425.1 hypothetical protein [Terracidiphilus sp.]